MSQSNSARSPTTRTAHAAAATKRPASIAAVRWATWRGHESRITLWLSSARRNQPCARTKLMSPTSAARMQSPSKHSQHCGGARNVRRRVDQVGGLASATAGGRSPQDVRRTSVSDQHLPTAPTVNLQVSIDLPIDAGPRQPRNIFLNCSSPLGRLPRLCAETYSKTWPFWPALTVVASCRKPNAASSPYTCGVPDKTNELLAADH
jgi:hypothetical protein